MKRLFTGILLCTLVLGCSPDAPVNKPMTPTLTTELERGAKETRLVPGDVESKVSLVATVMEKSAGDQVSIEETWTASKELVMTQIEVNGPRPTEFWIDFDIKSKQAFKETPVVVHGRVLRDDEVVDQFYTVLGEHATRRDRNPMDGVLPQNFEIDVLKGLTELPESILVQAEIDVLLMPEGTDINTVDPKSAEAPAERTGAVLGNVVRINFAGESNAS